ncbi:MAG TPA: O-antigen ligase family protein [Candidatus Sulfopaludibacter sp.]|nr:O-antigen ligase family protein [Candidatus Sulfopaludibacter sp.]
MALLQAAVAGLVALIVTPGALFYFDVTPKIAVLLAGTAALLIWPWPAGEARAPRAFSLLICTSLASLAVSTTLSTNPARSLLGANWRRYGAVTQAAVLIFAWLAARGVAGHSERARAILRGLTAAGALTAVYGITQYFGWDPILPKAAYHIGEGVWTIVRPPGTLGYVSYFATWLLAVVFISLALADWETRRWARRAAYAAAALSAVAMLLTGTRAASLGLAVGGAVWLCGRGFRVPRRAWLAAVAVVLVGAAFYYSPAGWQMRSRARWFREDRWGGSRVWLWRDSLAMAVRRPLGYGPETFTAQFPRFESPALARAYPDFLHESPHNIFLDAWVSQGIPGVVILGLFCWAGLAAARRAKRPGAIWLAASLAATIASQMFTVFTMPTALVFYLTIALLVAPEARPEPPRTSPIPLAPARWAVAMVLAYCAVRLTVADRQLELAKRALDRTDLATAATRFAEYDRLRFPGAGSDLWYSRACANLAARVVNPVVRVQALAQAGAAGVRATRTAGDPFNAWYSLSAIYAAQNDFPNTGRCLRAAIAARPNWFKPHWTLAQVLRLEGRLAEAEQESALAAGLDGGKHPEVARTLDEIRQAHPQPW